MPDQTPRYINDEAPQRCWRCEQGLNLVLSIVQQVDIEAYPNLTPYLDKTICDLCMTELQLHGDRYEWHNIPILWWRHARYQEGKRLFIKGCEKDGQEILRVTVNLPEEALDTSKRQIFIKNWSENEGLYRYLVSRCLVEPTEIFAPAGHAVAPMVILTDHFMKLLELTDEDLTQ